MNRLFIQSACLAMVPCLVLEPATAHALVNSPPVSIQALAVFSEEAFSVRLRQASGLFIGRRRDNASDLHLQSLLLTDSLVLPETYALGVAFYDENRPILKEDVRVLREKYEQGDVIRRRAEKLYRTPRPDLATPKLTRKQAMASAERARAIEVFFAPEHEIWEFIKADTFDAQLAFVERHGKNQTQKEKEIRMLAVRLIFQSYHELVRFGGKTGYLAGLGMLKLIAHLALFDGASQKVVDRVMEEALPSIHKAMGPNFKNAEEGGLEIIYWAHRLHDVTSDVMLTLGLPPEPVFRSAVDLYGRSRVDDYPVTTFGDPADPEPETGDLRLMVEGEMASIADRLRGAGLEALRDVIAVTRSRMERRRVEFLYNARAIMGWEPRPGGRVLQAEIVVPDFPEHELAEMLAIVETPAVVLQRLQHVLQALPSLKQNPQDAELFELALGKLIDRDMSLEFSGARLPRTEQTVRQDMRTGFLHQIGQAIWFVLVAHAFDVGNPDAMDLVEWWRLRSREMVAHGDISEVRHVYRMAVDSNFSLLSNAFADKFSIFVDGEKSIWSVLGDRLPLPENESFEKIATFLKRQFDRFKSPFFVPKVREGVGFDLSLGFFLAHQFGTIHFHLWEFYLLDGGLILLTIGIAAFKYLNPMQPLYKKGKISMHDAYGMEKTLRRVLFENSIDAIVGGVQPFQLGFRHWAKTLARIFAKIAVDHPALMPRIIQVNDLLQMQNADLPKMFENQYVERYMKYDVMPMLAPLESFGWSRGELDEVAESAKQAIRAHLGQTRDSGEPYMVHPMAVVDILIYLFDETDPLLVETGFLHDVLEDQSEYYHEMMTHQESTLRFIHHPIRVQLLGLTIRMLSKDEGDGQEQRYWRGLLAPHDVYPDDPYIRTHSNAHRDPNFPNIVHGVQRVKMSDGVHNWRFFNNFLCPVAATMSDRAKAKPARAFEKTLKYMLPLFVNQPDALLTRLEIELFYAALAQALFAHLAISLEEYPHAGPLIQAAYEAMPGLARAIMQNKYFADSPGLQALSRRLLAAARPVLAWPKALAKAA